MDWPLSIIGALGDIAPADKGPLTMTVTALEDSDSTGVPVSFTCSSNDQVPVVESGPVETEGRSPDLQLKVAPKPE